MFRISSWFIGAVFAALIAVPLTANVDPLGGWDEQFGGKYFTADGYVLLYVDETGKVAGYFERAGAFGEIRGRFDGRTVRGHWMQSEGSTVCERDLHGYESWGTAELVFDGPAGFNGKVGGCDAAPAAEWNGRR